MAQAQFLLYPVVWTPNPTGSHFNRESQKPSTLSQPELEMVLFLSNADPWKTQLIRSSMHYGGQFRPSKKYFYTVDFCAVNSKQIFEMDG